MKKLIISLISAVVILPIFTVILSLLASFIFAPKDSILESLPDYTSKEYYTCGGFQDTTDYAKYTYEIPESVLIHSSYFLRVSSVGADRLLTYLNDFDGWVKACEDFPSEHYDFDRSVISGDDYFYILNRYEEPDREFYSYNIYFFDLDSQILYYFHNNI